jgi:GAF domain-containing protein
MTPIPDKTAADPQQIIGELQRKVDELTAQQAATAEVLKVIAGSPTDVEPVLKIIVENACELCDAYDAVVLLRDRDDLRYSAHHGPIPIVLEKSPINRNWVTGRAVVDRVPMHVHDLLSAEGDQFSQTRETLAQQGHRTVLSVPLLREGESIGAITLRRFEVNPFSDKQIALLQTFADQAVVAIENARLFNETQEALERQTATADVLKVISRSSVDLGSVLHTLVQTIARLCRADQVYMFHLHHDLWHLVADCGLSAEARDFFRNNPFTPGRGATSGRAALERRAVHIPDVLQDPEYTLGKGQEVAGYRTTLGIPLLREDTLIGVYSIARTRVEPFTDKEIELATSFADQAVIAIENVRLFNEIREALERQTATADILKVIASSPSDVQPVFDAIATRSKQLVGGLTSAVYSIADEMFHLKAFTPTTPEADAFLQAAFPRPLSSFFWAEQTLAGELVEFSDVETEWVGQPDALSMARFRGFRSLVFIPLRHYQTVIGVILVTRAEPGRFAFNHVQLLETFADQAVIAIENVRLFDEVQAKTRDLTEALTHQTGSANILRVIASSPTDVKPVLDAIVESACELCEAYDAAVVLQDGEHLRFSAHHGPIPIGIEKWPISRHWVSGRAFIDQTAVHIHDLRDEAHTDLPDGRELALRMGHRTILAVPLLREGTSIGAIVLRRTEVHPFTEKQIALLQTFADQAVIAIGNVRLFEQVQARTHELVESLEQQTATSDVLSVISRSAGNLAPVFDAMLGKAMQLCSANFGVLNTYDGARFHTEATYGLPPAYDKFRRRQPLEYGPATAPARLLRGEPFVEIDDLFGSDAYRSGEANRRALVDLGGARCLLAVPLLKDGRVVGNVMIFRQENRRFSQKQITLLQQFAAQAVIAIENARLLNELHQRTADLSQSLDDLRTAQDRLVQTEKLASLGQLTAGIAHEIKNPLNFVNNFSALSAELVAEMSDLLAKTSLDAATRQELEDLGQMLKSNLEKVVQHGKRADSIVKNMLQHSREGSGEHRSVDINTIVDESLNLAYHGARAEKPGFNIALQRDLDPSAGMADVYPQEITRVLLNIISNGFYAAAKRKAEVGECFEPKLTAMTKNLGDKIEIRIRDNGTGVPDSAKEKIFDPFFTTKPAGEGTGLGLSISHDIIVKQHGGSIDVDTEPGLFTEFKIVLPRSSER